MKKLKLLFASLALVLGSGAMQAQDAGTYYIQNVSNGKWMGPGNNWSTQASVLNHADYWKMAKISDGVYTLESVVSNGGTSYYFAGEYCDGGATNFTFSPVAGKENVYTVANGDGKFMTTNGTIVNMTGTDATAAVSQWKLWSEADMAAGMAAATVENPFDATYLIKDHDLGRNNRDYSKWSNTGATAPKSSADFQGATVYSVEAYCKTFDVNQTLTGVPNGVYALRVNGFYRQDGSNANLPYLYANESNVTLPVRTGSENNMQDAAVSFVAGNYLSDPVYVQVTDGTLKVGVKTEGNSCWVIFKNFHLTYYGNVTVAEVQLADYVKAYNEAHTVAVAFTEGSMFASDWTALQTAITNNTIDLSGDVTQSQLETATANLKAANTAATLAVSKKTSYDNAVTLIDGGSNVDLTSIVVNAGFELGTMEGWTSADGGAQANNKNFSKMSGEHFVERWKNGAALGNGSLTHDPLCLPKGIYTITAEAQNIEQYNGNAGGTGYFLCANDEKAEIGVAGTYSTSVILTEKQDLTIKFLLDNCTGNWISCDNVTLTYVGEDFPAYTLVTGKMNADVAAAQTAADEAFQANKTIANYNTLTAAIAAAQASKDAYAIAATAIANAEDLQTNHNFATAAAATTFAEAIAAIKVPYTNNTLTTDAGNAAGTTLGTVVTGWHAGANSAAAKYLNNGFSLNDFDAALYINTWSIEGESDGSNFKVPFYEYFAGDGSALAANTWTGTLTGLEDGLYEVSAWVRIRTKNAETAVDDLKGITMNVNGGTAVDVTEGEQVGTSRFQLKEYTAQGLVKNGTLNLNIVIDGENNIHWLSFKNVKYAKVRDLTPEEAAVAPADLALDATATVFVGKTLTLTPTSTTADASIDGFVTWESDNEGVATVSSTGVVTPVSYGTANITVTSTLNSSATATCEVTVTAPLYSEAENLDFADGPVVNSNIRTYAKDIAGTDVANMQTVAGWTMNVANGDAKASGIMTYGSSNGMGDASVFAPATNPNGETTGNVFGMVGVWTGSVQYVQPVKLPAGAYTITVPIYRNGGGSALTKNLIGVILDDNTEHFATTKTYAANAWTTETISFVINDETYGKLSIGLNAPNVGSGSSQRLWIAGFDIVYEPFASTADYADLNDAIDANEGKTLGFQAGEYAPYNNVEVLEALAAAKAIDQTANNAQSAIQAATAALTGATWTANTTDVDAIYNGSFSSENDWGLTGWTRTNGWGQQRNDVDATSASSSYGYYNQPGSLQYGNQGVYSMPLKGNTVYQLSFKYASWENNSNNGMTVSVLNGEDGMAALSFEANGKKYNTKGAFVTKTFVFATGAAGNYVLTLGNSGNTVMTDVSITKAASQVLEFADGQPLVKYAPGTYPAVKVSRTMTKDRWVTAVYPFALSIPTALSGMVSVATLDSYNKETGALGFASASANTANVPFLMRSTNETAIAMINANGLTATNVAVAAATVSDATAAEASLKGTYAVKEITNDEKNYVLSNNVIYPVGTAGATINPYRAYIQIAQDAPEARLSFFVDNEEVTGIEGIQMEKVAKGAVYNLNGQRVEKAKKGLYIQGGKKLYVK